MSWLSEAFGWFGSVFSGTTGEVCAGLKDIAHNAVDNAENLAGASGPEKRDAAFAEIKEKAIDGGLVFATHAINLLIETCVAELKD